MVTMHVKKVSELRSLDEFNLSAEVYDVLSEYKLSSLVLFARREDLFGALMRARGVYHVDQVSQETVESETRLCQRCADEFRKELKEKGFFRTDFDNYRQSFNIMSFLRVLIGGNYNDDYFDEFYNARREWKSFTNEEYETFGGLTQIQINTFMMILEYSLSEYQFRVICERMGLHNGICVDRKTVAKEFGMTEREIFNMEKSAFQHMKGVMNAGVLRRMYQNFLELETKDLSKI